MTKQVDVITVPTDLSLSEYGSRDDVVALSRRIKSLMPGGERLTDEQAMAAAQYAILTDTNWIRGEIYAYPDGRGKLNLVDGYKLLVRWAKRQCAFAEKYEPLPKDGLPIGAIGYTCWILRDDNRVFLREMVTAGASFQEAFEIAATSAVGIVTATDRTTRNGKPQPPPAGWTWDQVARKRALKNALNQAYGMPSPREIADASWCVNGIETAIDDWLECTPEMPVAARERLAEMHARHRLAEPDDRTPEQVLAENHAILYGEDCEEL